MQEAKNILLTFLVLSWCFPNCMITIFDNKIYFVNYGLCVHYNKMWNHDTKCITKILSFNPHHHWHHSGNAHWAQRRWTRTDPSWWCRPWLHRIHLMRARPLLACAALCALASLTLAAAEWLALDVWLARLEVSVPESNVNAFKKGNMNQRKKKYLWAFSLFSLWLCVLELNGLWVLRAFCWFTLCWFALCSFAFLRCLRLLRLRGFELKQYNI